MNEEIREELDRIWKEFEKVKDKLKRIEGHPSFKVDDGLKNNISSMKSIGENSSIVSSVKVFCENNKIDFNDFSKLIQIQDNFPKLIKLPVEKIRKKIQINSLLILAPIYYRGYGRNLSEKNIRKLFSINNVPSERMDKLYSSKPFKKFFGKSGTKITLKWAGETEGIKKINEIIEYAKQNNS